MEKKDFINLMEEFIKLKKDTDDAHEAMVKLDPDFGGLTLSRHESMIMRLIEKLMKDEKNGWIGYWMYELNFGKNATKSSVEINDKNISIKTLSDLFNIIKNERD
jgi:hypothetical protein